MIDARDLDDFLVARVVLGETVGAQLDEREIGREFDVPRAGVRASLARLVENGVIKRARRVGTVPAHERWRFDLIQPTQSSETGERLFQTRSVERLRVSGALAVALEVPAGTMVTRVHQVGLAGEAVIQSWVGWSTLGYDYWIARVGESDTLRWHDVAGPLTGLSQLRVRRAFSTLQASSADAELFSVVPGTPLNFIDTVMRTPDGDFISRSFGRTPSRHTLTIAENLVSLDTKE